MSAKKDQDDAKAAAEKSNAKAEADANSRRETASRSGEASKSPAGRERFEDKPKPDTDAADLNPDAAASTVGHAGAIVDRSDRIAAQRERAEADLAKLSEHNAEGHEKNMRKIEAQAEVAQSVEEKTGPATGKEVNHNTPIIDPKTGAKTWR